MSTYSDTQIAELLCDRDRWKRAAERFEDMLSQAVTLLEKSTATLGEAVSEYEILARKVRR